MKIQIDGTTVFELSETKKKILQSEIAKEIFLKDMQRRAKWVIEHKYQRCVERFRKEWEHKLKSQVKSFPSDDEEFAQLVFSHPDYKDKSAKLLAEKDFEHRERTGQL